MTADTYSTDGVGFLEMGTGNDNNTWGTNQNNNVFQVLCDSITNTLTSAVTGGTLDLSGTPPPAASSQVRYAGLAFTGVLGSAQSVKVPNLNKWWLVKNATSGAFALTFKTPSGSASAAIPQNSGWQIVQCDGSDNIVVWPFNTKQIQMPDGSAAAPSYSDVNETGSGWYREGTQDWRLSINGVDVLQVTGTGAGSPSIVNVLSPNALQVAGVAVVTGSIPLTSILIHGGVALTAPDVADEAAVYDASAGSNKRITLANFFNVINLLTAETSPAVDDVLAMYDTSETAANAMTFANFLKVVNVLTEDTSPDVTNDFFLSYDASASAAKKVAPVNFGAARIPKAAGRFSIAMTLGGSISTIDSAGDTLTTSAPHNLVTGNLVTIAGNIPTPLSTNNIYYVNALTTTQVALYSTLANALADTSRIDITGGVVGGQFHNFVVSVNSGTGFAANALQFTGSQDKCTGTITLATAMSSANWSFSWQYQQSSTTLTAPATPAAISQSTTVLTFTSATTHEWGALFVTGTTLYIEFAAWDG